MKNDFNKFTKNDLPFDSYSDLPIETYEHTTKNDNEKNLKKRQKKLQEEQKIKKQVKNPDPNNKKNTSNKKTHLKSNGQGLQELEELNEQNIRNFRYRSRRNRVIIISLVILLLLTIVGIAVYTSLIYLQSNCFLYVHGDCEATYIVDGNELSKFRTPNNLQGNRVFNADFDIKLESSGNYNVKFKIDVYQSNELLDNILIYEPNKELFQDGGDGYFYSRSAISGRQTIDLCLGVILDLQYEDTLNVNNFKLEFHTYFERV